MKAAAPAPWRVAKDGAKLLQKWPTDDEKMASGTSNSGLAGACGLRIAAEKVSNARNIP